MAAPPVVDSSPVIVLARVGLLPLLRLAGDPVLLPTAVVQEIQQAGPNDPAAQALSQTPWLLTVDPGPVAPALLPFALDVGEAAVLTWALMHAATEAILDEARARRCAIQLGIPCRGCVGLVLAARRQGVIPLARPVLVAMRQAGFYLSDRTMNQALALVGE